MHWDVDLLWEWAINPKNTEPEKSQREPKPSRRIIQREHLHNLADMSLYKIHATLFGILTTSLAVETLVKFSSVSLIGLGLTRLFESRTTGSMYWGQQLKYVRKHQYSKLRFRISKVCLGYVWTYKLNSINKMNIALWPGPCGYATEQLGAEPLRLSGVTIPPGKLVHLSHNDHSEEKLIIPIETRDVNKPQMTWASALVSVFMFLLEPFDLNTQLPEKGC